jgi:hypothetical protein
MAGRAKRSDSVCLTDRVNEPLRRQSLTTFRESMAGGGGPDEAASLFGIHPKAYDCERVVANSRVRVRAWLNRQQRVTIVGELDCDTRLCDQRLEREDP